MKAVVYDAPGQFEVRDIPQPVPQAGQVLLKVLIAGICGTDLHLHHGEFGPSYPLIPGHEIVGEVIAHGSGVTAPGIGQRVTIDNTTSCGVCTECRRARPAFCTTLVAQGVNAPGGFAEYVVATAGRCFPVDDLSDDVAVFTEPTACVVHGLDVLAMPPASRVLVFGAGPTGLILSQLLARSGAGELTVAAPTVAKLNIAAAHGADCVVLIDRADPAGAAGQLRKHAGNGYDVVVDATGNVDVLAQTISLTRTGGTVFVYGMTAESDLWPVPPYEVFRRELTIKGSFAQQFSFDRALIALRTGRVATAGMITHRFGLNQYGDALAAVADSSCIKAVLVP